eukprot:TRINITY_DN61445_c0_g1_i1.p1 TRINITY_DN61445_c0_g1~~TRINITY_DN61445_c0_g1_i1.p1  ORF type:complete len:183 (+),score=31.78 TRINITY_DN61445_c0_g1_i1:94-642(+)
MASSSRCGLPLPSRPPRIRDPTAVCEEEFLSADGAMAQKMDDSSIALHEELTCIKHQLRCVSQRQVRAQEDLQTLLTLSFGGKEAPALASQTCDVAPPMMSEGCPLATPVGKNTSKSPTPSYISRAKSNCESSWNSEVEPLSPTSKRRRRNGNSTTLVKSKSSVGDIVEDRTASRSSFGGAC